MNTVTQMVMGGLNNVAEGCDCVFFVNPLSQTKGSGYVYRRNMTKTELTMVYEFEPDSGTYHVRCFLGNVNPLQPGKNKPVVALNAGYHEVEKLNVFGQVMEKVLKRDQQPKAEQADGDRPTGVELPAELLEMAMAATRNGQEMVVE